MATTAKSLILDLLSTLGRHSAPVRALIGAAELFGLAGNNVRVTLARLLAEGLVERDERGRYHLGPDAGAVNRRIRSWRRPEERMRRWDGGWIGVHSSGMLSARERRRRTRALRLLGFRSLETGLEIRPDNWVGGADALRAELAALGLPERAPVFRLSDLDPATQGRALALWDPAPLVDGHRETAARLDASLARLTELPHAKALVESFELGGDGIRQLVLDPLLPEEIVPGKERQKLVASMRRYDAAGRRIWAGWLGEAAPRSERSPAGVRGQEGSGEWLRAAEGR
jgi:phenylacetic acid degradation operon negative regulatory protein